MSDSQHMILRQPDSCFHTPLNIYTRTQTQRHALWMTDLPHPPAANRPKDREVAGLRSGLRVWLEAKQETDTWTDKTPKGWWMDGRMSEGRSRSKRSWEMEEKGKMEEEKMKMWTKAGLAESQICNKVSYQHHKGKRWFYVTITTCQAKASPLTTLGKHRTFTFSTKDLWC